jgi:hypothetical protein
MTPRLHLFCMALSAFTDARSFEALDAGPLADLISEC